MIEKERLQLLLPKDLAEMARQDASSKYLKISAWGEQILVNYFEELEKGRSKNRKIIDLTV